MYQRHDADSAPRKESDDPSLSLPLSDWLITVTDDSQQGLAEVVAGVIAKIEAYVAKHGLQKEAPSIDGYDNVGVIAIRCSARLQQVIEEFPEVLAIEQSQTAQPF